MQRRAARKVMEETESLVGIKNDSGNQDMTDSSLQIQVDISPEILQKLSPQSDELDSKTMTFVVEYLARKYDYDFDSFKIFDNAQNFKTFLLPSTSSLFLGDKAQNLFILILVDFHWVVFCILQKESRILYKDPRGFPLVNSEYLAIFNQSSFASTKMTCHNMAEMDPKLESSENAKAVHDSAVLSLKNLEIILQKLNSKFIREFRSTKFSFKSQLKQIKNDYSKELQSNWSSSLGSDLMKLKTDLRFKEFVSHLNIFMDTCLIYAEMSGSTQNYVNILDQELKKSEGDESYLNDNSNFDELYEAKKTMLGHSKVKEILENEKQKILNNSATIPLPYSKSKRKVEKENDNAELNLMAGRVDIKEKFPWHMSIFTNFFKLLFNCKADGKLELVLKYISHHFELDYEKVKRFFEFEKNHVRMETSEIPQNCQPPNPKSQILNGINVQLLTASLCVEKNDEKIEFDKEIKTLDRLLYEFMRSNVEENSTNLMSAPPYNKTKLKEFYTNFYATNKTAIKLKELYSKVKENYRETWSTKSAQEIHEFATKIQKSSKRLKTPELIAMMDRANELITGGHRLRIPQIISLLAFLQSEKSKKKGKLCQIHTGEGKTTIVGMLAAIKIFEGESSVDVITSNNVLAQESVDDRLKFFTLLGLSVTTNNEQVSDVKKVCYAAQIVYGSIGSFQFDYLRDLTDDNAGVRMGRKFSCLVLDEVDSMIIDSGGHIAKLSVPLPGMDSLKYIYIKIWQTLCTAEATYVKEMIEIIQGQDGDLSLLEPIMIQNTYDHIRKKIVESDPLKMDLIPRHLKKFAQNSLEKWIDNAMYAKFSCNENEQYTLQKSIQGPNKGEMVIVPLDYANTGVTMKNTIWSHGLHQFIQLKHNLQLTPESLTSSCISNYGYINLYGQNIFGLTGTLGSKPEQKLIGRMYNVDFAYIPTFKCKKFEELQGRVVKDADWAMSIAVEAEIQALQKKRAILIISKTIADCIQVENALQKLKIGSKSGFSDSNFNIKKFYDESGTHILKSVVKPGDIIIATNIAGRGADFKTTPDLETAGGLHVCTTFYPDNERVKDQAFFRTARQGNQGSARVIMRESEVKNLGIDTSPGLYKIDFLKIKSHVEALEVQRINFLIETKVAQLYFQDYLFFLFTNLCRESKEGEVRQPSHWVESFQTFIPTMKDQKVGPKKLNLYVLNDLKEFWAFWLDTQKFESDPLFPPDSDESKEKNPVKIEKYLRDKANVAMADFKSQAAEILKGKISHNPYYAIQLADSHINQDKLNEAEKELERVILDKSGSDVLYAAHMKLFEISVKKGGVLMNRFKDAMAKVFVLGYFYDFKDEEYKAKAARHLKNAQLVLLREIEYMKNNIFQSPDFSIILTNNSASQRKEGEEEKNILLKHLQSRLVCLSVYNENAGQMLNQLEELGSNSSHGLYIGSRVPDYLKNLEEDNEKGLKEIVQESTLNELGVVGLDTIYALQKVHDVPHEILLAAQGQIAAGIATHLTGIAFPPILPITAPLAGALISEGILDIALELLVNFQGRSEFNGKAYLQGKLASYGISLLTCGLNAVVSSSKILAKASKACQSLAELLRQCPYLKTLCEILAKQLDKLGTLLQAMSEAAKVANQVNKVQKLTSITWDATKGAAKGVVGSLVMEKVTTHVLDATLQSLKPKIQAVVLKSVGKYINSKLLAQMSPEQLAKICVELMEGSTGQMLGKVAQDIGLGVLRHSNTWKMKLTSMAIDTCITSSKIIFCAQNFCTQLNEGMRQIIAGNEKSTNTPNSNAGQMEEQIIRIITDHIYTLIIQLAGKYTNMFVVTPLVNKLFDAFSSKKTKEEKPDEEETKKEEETETSKDEKKDPREELCQKLGLAPDATDDEINMEAARKTADTSISDILASGLARAKEGGALGTTADLEILSSNVGQPITVVDENGVEKTYGKDNTTNGGPIKVEFYEGENGPPGHYTLPGGVEAPNSGDGNNNCLLDCLAKQSRVQTSSNELRGMLQDEYTKGIEDCHAKNGEIDMLRNDYDKFIGGCPITKYDNVEDTKKVVDNSEGKASDYTQQRSMITKSNKPVPTAHAQSTHVKGGDKFVGKKTGFENQNIQAQVAHEILIHPDVHAQLEDFMNVSPNKADRCIVTIPADQIDSQNIIVYQGNQDGSIGTAKSYTLIIEHGVGEKNNTTSEPIIQTCFPSINPVKGVNVEPKYLADITKNP